MQYKVPQNIDQEDKILGPLTFIQLIYVLIGGGLILVCFAFFDFALFLLTAIPIAILTICFALIKVQDQPFSHFLLSLLVYLRQPKKRLWHDLQAETPDPATADDEDFFADLNKKKKDKKKAKEEPAPTSPTNASESRSSDPAGVGAALPVKPARKVPIAVIKEGSGV